MIAARGGGREVVAGSWKPPRSQSWDSGIRLRQSPQLLAALVLSLLVPCKRRICNTARGSPDEVAPLILRHRRGSDRIDRHLYLLVGVRLADRHAKLQNAIRPDSRMKNHTIQY